MKKKIVFYGELIVMGGIETSTINLMKYLYKDYDLFYVYNKEVNRSEVIINQMKEYAEVYSLNELGTSILECDFCVWSYIYFDYEKARKIIKAKSYMVWSHTLLLERENNKLYDKDFMKEIDKIIYVSEVVKEKVNLDKENIIIHNFINPDIKDDIKERTVSDKLNLVVVSRLSVGKGFERLFEFVVELEEKGVDFKVSIIGDGRSYEQTIREMFRKKKNVEFLGVIERPYQEIYDADYLVQLSDAESWGNNITEAKILGTPCIITNFAAAKLQIENDFNGIILPLETVDYSGYIEKIIKNKNIYRENLKQFKHINEIDKWKSILESK